MPVTASENFLLVSKTSESQCGSNYQNLQLIHDLDMQKISKHILPPFPKGKDNS